jgi:hypothetical protein
MNKARRHSQKATSDIYIFLSYYQYMQDLYHVTCRSYNCWILFLSEVLNYLGNTLKMLTMEGNICCVKHRYMYCNKNITVLNFHWNIIGFDTRKNKCNWWRWAPFDGSSLLGNRMLTFLVDLIFFLYL